MKNLCSVKLSSVKCLFTLDLVPSLVTKFILSSQGLVPKCSAQIQEEPVAAGEFRS